MLYFSPITTRLSYKEDQNAEKTSSPHNMRSNGFYIMMLEAHKIDTHNNIITAEQEASGQNLWLRTSYLENILAKDFVKLLNDKQTRVNGFKWILPKPMPQAVRNDSSNVLHCDLVPSFQ